MPADKDERAEAERRFPGTITIPRAVLAEAYRGLKRHYEMPELRREIDRLMLTPVPECGTLSVPEGMKCVPTKPTPRMLEIAYEKAAFPRDPEILAAVWTAMVEAAPTLPYAVSARPRCRYTGGDCTRNYCQQRSTCQASDALIDHQEAARSTIGLSVEDVKRICNTQRQNELCCSGYDCECDKPEDAGRAGSEAEARRIEDELLSALSAIGRSE